MVEQLSRLVLRNIPQISRIKPSDWVEANIVMGKPFPGPFRYKRTPYVREIIDILSPDCPCWGCAVKKGGQIGFALDINTDIPTPNGFRKMGELKEGDLVYSEYGLPIRVTMATEIMYNHKCYEVNFSDGTKINADANHLWSVYDQKYIKRTLTTELIKIKSEKFKNNRIRKSCNKYYIQNSQAIFNHKKELPIDPYLLGLWLGDGSTTSNTITATKKDAIFYKDELYKRGIEVLLTPYKDQPNTFHIRVQNVFNVWKGGKNIYGNKHIPEIYFTASVEQRLDLLQGLIDTDGHIMSDGKVEFYNVNKKLINQVKTLIASLGYKVTIRERDNTGKLTNMHPTRKYKMKNIFALNFMGIKELPAAKLPRKRDRLRSIKDLRIDISRRWITGINEIESVSVKCISVDSESKLYLASKSFIPTHNSSGVIYPGICWIIKNNPGNTSLSVGAPELIKKATDKLDAAINSSGIRDYIKPSALRKRNNKTGDTNTQKDFTGGFAMIWSANNHKNIRQVDLENQFNDDFVAIKKSSKESGSTDKKLDQRSAAYADTKKRMDISTPELVGSTIDEAFERGDKRRFLIPCPCCSDMITIDWKIPSLIVPGKMAGITWKLKENGQLDKESVGYICPLCDGFFNDKDKQTWLNKGEWVAFAITKVENYRSYQISALYAPVGMDGWDKYVNDFIEINAPGKPRKEEDWQWFMNEVLGESYEPPGTSILASDLERNIRGYSIGSLPDAQSMADGNGHIILLTLTCDLGGRYIGDQIKSTYDDARLDWEIIGHCENGSTYSINHGSIGTFRNAHFGKQDEGRELWSYDITRPNNVWRELDRIIEKPIGDLNIYLTGIDSGFADHHVFNYIESRTGRFKIIALKGDKENKPVPHGLDKKNWKDSYNRSNQFILQVGNIKDMLASRVSLKWDGIGKQPSGFMNFPQRSEGKYEKENYFSHFEAEHRVIDAKKGTFIWEKKSSTVQNHIFDLNVYSMALKEIIMFRTFKEIKIDPLIGTWHDFSEWVLAGRRAAWKSLGKDPKRWESGL